MLMVTVVPSVPSVKPLTEDPAKAAVFALLVELL
jgi:hypothetical protein